MIINFLPVFKRLEDGVYLDLGLLKNVILKCFRWPIFYSNETVCSKHSSLTALLKNYIGISNFVLDSRTFDRRWVFLYREGDNNFSIFMIIFGYS